MDLGRTYKTETTITGFVARISSGLDEVSCEFN
jgi:hypothetical protein